MTLGNGKVVKVRWDIYEVCARNGNDFQKSANTLKAPIRNGHFSKRVTYQIFPEPSFLSTIDVTTTVSGTITGKTAKVKVSDTRRSFETGKCSGSHKFTVREVPG
jgi:hypothetical protein